MTRDTVATETPAICAISRSDTGLFSVMLTHLPFRIALLYAAYVTHIVTKQAM